MSRFASNLEMLTGESGRFGMVASGIQEGIFAIDFADPSIVLVTKAPSSCSLWKADLHDEAILKHVRDLN